MTDLSATDAGVVDLDILITMGFNLLGTPFVKTVDTSDFICTTYFEGNVVDTVSISDGTTITVNKPTASTEMSVSLFEGTTGATGTDMTITYTTQQAFNLLSWIYIMVPKANALYDTGNNADSAQSFITDATKNDMTFSIDGTTFDIDTS